MSFWQEKRLDEMTPEEWESLCDGCGKCCLLKIEWADTGEIEPTCVTCRLLDSESCRCTDYPNRKARVPDCIQLSPHNVAEIAWMPSSCAYRLLHEGKDLYWWHPLVSGDPETVHLAQMSVRGKVISEDEIGTEQEDLERHIVDWAL